MADDLDSILESALEDFEREEKPAAARTSSSSPAPPPPAPSPSNAATPPAEKKEMTEEEEDAEAARLAQEFTEGMAKLLQELKTNPELGSLPGMEELLKTGNPFAPATTTTTTTTATTAPAQDGDIEAKLAEALEQIAKSAAEGDGASNPEDMMTRMQQMAEMMMRQFLSKDILYEPLVAMRDKYPGWLAQNKSKLSDKEFQNYTKQHEYIQMLCEVYERDSNNSARIMQLMEEMQEYGKPPLEIVRELSPDPAVAELFADESKLNSACPMQ